MAAKQIAPWRWLVALLGLSLGLGATVGIYAAMSREASVGSLILMGLVVAGLMAVGVWLVAMYWRRLDEAAREAHKWAWFWGGNVALLPLIVGLFFLLERPDLQVPLWPGLQAGPAGYVATGGFIVVFTLLIGYSLAWLYWWLWKSR